MKKGRVLLLGGNYFPEPTGIGKYNGEMMDWLSVQGFQCTVVTTYPYYPFWKIQAPYSTKESFYKKEEKICINGVPINIYRCLHYVPAVPCGSKRIFSDISFFCSAFFLTIYFLFRKKYDYVITVAPPFQLGLLGYLYKKIKGAKLVYHIQDLQIDAAFELGMIRSKYVVKLMFGIERFILKKADCVSSISEGMIQKIKAKFNREVLLFPNWADIKAFHPILNKTGIRNAFDFSDSDKIVLYSGAIGEKQGLQALLRSAEALRYHKEIKFIICGSGPYSEKLIEEAKQMLLENVIFMPLQPLEKFNQFLNMADVHLVLQKANAHDLMMPSKLTTILSIGGLAVVTAEPGTSLHEVISQNNMGILIDPENQEALTVTILDAVNHPYTELKRNARQYAECYLSIDKIIPTYFSQISGAEKTDPFNRHTNKKLKVDAVAH